MLPDINMRMRIDKNMMTSASELLLFALSIFSSGESFDKVVSAQSIDDVLCFEAASGRRGFVERNSSGEWDVWVGPDLMHVIDDDVYCLITEPRRDLFKDLTKMVVLMKVPRSRRTEAFLVSMKVAIENIIMQAPDSVAAAMDGSTRIGPAEYIYNHGKKAVCFLN